MNNTILVILCLLLLLLPSKSLHAEQVRVTENLRGETVLLPPSTPEKAQLVLVSFSTVIAQAEIIGGMAIFDNPQSGGPASYVELFDGRGGLLLISWIDRFGIRRTAMDRGLLQEEASRLDGILVLLVEGTSI